MFRKRTAFRRCVELQLRLQILHNLCKIVCVWMVCSYHSARSWFCCVSASPLTSEASGDGRPRPAAGQHLNPTRSCLPTRSCCALSHCSFH